MASITIGTREGSVSGQVYPITDCTSSLNNTAWVQLCIGDDTVDIFRCTEEHFRQLSAVFAVAAAEAKRLRDAADAANHAQDETDVANTEIDPNNDGQIAPINPPPLDDCRWVKYADLPEWVRNVIHVLYNSSMVVADYRWVQLANGSWASSYAQELNAKAKS